MATKPDEIATEETVATAEPAAKTPAHAGFDKSGKCMTCNEKIRTNTDGKIFCPIAQPKCPRNKK